jgi:hypothetical protein
MKELRWAMAEFRVAMGVTFLSPVADRFGLRGLAGTWLLAAPSHTIVV